jgi:Lon protease-like protein
LREEEVLNDQSTIPLFVCTLAYPTMPIYLYIFEPRYRLMVRRALESGSRKFGMVMSNRTNSPQGELGVTQFMQCGTLLHIDRFEMLRDGRSLIEARGVSRFKVLQWEMLDGYFVGKTERIEDISLAEEENLEARETEGREISSPTDGRNYQELDRLSTQQLLQISLDYVSKRKAESAPWLHERVLAAYGQPPSDPAVFPYWFASVLPIFEEERYSLLPMTSVRERLKATAGWVQTLEDMEW